VIVADVNLIAYYLLKGEFSADAQAVRRVDDQWVAPPEWSSEFLNILATGLRRGSYDRAVALNAWQVANQITPAKPPTVISPETVLDLSITSGVATYDGAYVVLARSLGLKVVTNDWQLWRMFPDVAVSIHGFVANAWRL
jgi:predicted nucleic acid-binding protein